MGKIQKKKVRKFVKTHDMGSVDVTPRHKQSDSEGRRGLSIMSHAIPTSLSTLNQQ